MNGSWFTTDYDYSGYATATFDNPRLELNGPALVRAGADGRPIVEVTTDRTNPAIQSEFDLQEVRYGSRAIPGGKVLWVGGDDENRVRAVVRGEEGIFRCGPDWRYNLSFVPEGKLKLIIEPLKSEFEAVDSALETWLVLPLSGFAPEFPMSESKVSGHPLNLGDQCDPQQEHCITIELGGKTGVIQQLPQVRRVAAEIELAAVAVLPIVDLGMVDPWGWFPTAFLRLLEFATVSEMAVPWIETRDENGRLTRRIHLAIGNENGLAPGYGILPKKLHWLSGEYLTSALLSPPTREAFFSIALRHCIRAGIPGLTLDDQLDHLVRALECLCLRYELSKQDLTNGLDSGLVTRLHQYSKTRAMKSVSLVVQQRRVLRAKCQELPRGRGPLI